MCLISRPRKERKKKRSEDERGMEFISWKIGFNWQRPNDGEERSFKNFFPFTKILQNVSFFRKDWSIPPLYLRTEKKKGRNSSRSSDELSSRTSFFFQLTIHRQRWSTRVAQDSCAGRRCIFGLFEREEEGWGDAEEEEEKRRITRRRRDKSRGRSHRCTLSN